MIDGLDLHADWPPMSWASDTSSSARLTPSSRPEWIGTASRPSPTGAATNPMRRTASRHTTEGHGHGSRQAWLPECSPGDDGDIQGLPRPGVSTGPSATGSLPSRPWDRPRPAHTASGDDGIDEQVVS